jgi:hypothetical protein
VEQNHFNFFNRGLALFEPHHSTNNIAHTASLLGIFEKNQLIPRFFAKKPIEECQEGYLRKSSIAHLHF